MQQRSLGFVYVQHNEKMPDLLKIGQTSRLSEDRARELRQTGVPSPFDVKFRALTSHARELEQAVHKLLDPYRYRSDREFFEVDLEVAIKAILDMRQKIDGVTAWSKRSPVCLRPSDRLLLSMRAGQVFMLFGYSSPLHLLAGKPTIYDFWQAHADGDTLEIQADDGPDFVAGFSDTDPGAEEDPVPFLNRDGTASNDIIYGRERLAPGDRLLWMDDERGDCASLLIEAHGDCQVVSRTRDPQFSPEGFPMLFNYVGGSLSPAMVRTGREALKLPPPRVWAPRQASAMDAPAAIAKPAAPPEHWLPQLANRSTASKRRKRAGG
ncbi:MAG: GIY-YIG nuclease family protein [Gemmatimonadales bacterium]